MTALNADQRTALDQAFEQALFPGADSRDYMFFKVSLPGFCVSAALLFPSVRLWRGGYFLEPVSDDALASWSDHGLPINELEALINHIHVWDLFELKGDLLDPDLTRAVQSLIANAWRLHLPAVTGRKVLILLSDEPDDYGPTVTFSTEPG